ncbi:hypothetical protein EIN_249330 [Entamoeba invadens IP1]|uniref:Uncharacterized protein n=1 Tax=Entamoeba invadens IP1 TaxID=370355 RepID=A0A0A1UGH1_ENTIV|nr:hypothetical protein EIN_249330 [Entamoeba invadens IP1]ELP94899.1 hypothetical protein EIN_249330 [Entamoeba invadens IP1]|eukprot:XP_004261670.1 hypothetical protein EIN_249330 [Entamoeba invadens IP1]
MCAKLEQQEIREVLQYILNEHDITLLQFVCKKFMTLYKTLMANPVLSAKKSISPIEYYTSARQLFPRSTRFVVPFNFALLTDAELSKYETFEMTKDFKQSDLSYHKKINKGVIITNFKQEFTNLEFLSQRFSLEEVKQFLKWVDNFPSLQYVCFTIGEDVIKEQQLVIQLVNTLFDKNSDIVICLSYEIEHEEVFKQVDSLRKALPQNVLHYYNFVIFAPEDPDKVKEEHNENNEIDVQIAFKIPMLQNLDVKHFVDFLGNEEVAKEYVKYFYPLEVHGAIADIDFSKITSLTKIVTTAQNFSFSAPTSLVEFVDLNDELTTTTKRVLTNLNELKIERMRTPMQTLIPNTVTKLEMPFCFNLTCPANLIELTLGSVDKKDVIIFNSTLQTLDIGDYPKTLNFPKSLTKLRAEWIKAKLNNGVKEIEVSKLKKMECQFIPDSVTRVKVVSATTFDFSKHTNLKELDVCVTIANSTYKFDNFRVSPNLEKMNLYIIGKVTKNKKPTFMESIRNNYQCVKNLIVDADFKQILPKEVEID